MVFIKKVWMTNRIDVSFIHADTITITLTISKENTQYSLCAIHRPPNMNASAFLDELYTFFHKYMNQKHFIIAGDLNIDIMKETKSITADYLNFLAEFGLVSTYNESTREEHLGANITKSCIDHIIIRLQKQQYVSGVIKQKLADHYFVTVAIMSSDHGTNGGTIRGSVFDNKKVDQLIHNVNWSSRLHFDHISLYKKTVEILRDVYEQSTISVNIHIRSPDKKRITREIPELSCRKDKAWRKCRKQPENKALRDEYRALRNQVTAKM